jgi:hypothetical protein
MLEIKYKKFTQNQYKKFRGKSIPKTSEIDIKTN